MGEKILKTLTNNIGFKLLALFFAIVLWLVVYNMDDPVKTKNITVTATISNEDTLHEQGYYPIFESGENRYVISVSGKRSYVDSLDEDDISMSIDFDRINSQSEKDGVSYVYVQAAISLNKSSYESVITINGGKTREVAIKVGEYVNSETFDIEAKTSGDPADGYIVSEVYISSNDATQVEISGPKELVDSIKEAQVTINVENKDSDTRSPEKIKLIDSDGNKVASDELTLSIDEVNVIAKITNAKEVPINFVTTGDPATGLAVLKISSDVESVQIKGSASALNNISSLDVVAMDVSGLEADTYENTVNITEYLPEGVELVDASDANITVKVKIGSESDETEISLLTSNITVEGLEEGYTYSFAAESVSFTVTGTAEDIKKLKNTVITGTINLSDYSGVEGEQKVPVTINLDSSKYSYSSVKVSIVITKTDSSDSDSDDDSATTTDDADETSEEN